MWINLSPCIYMCAIVGYQAGWMKLPEALTSQKWESCKQKNNGLWEVFFSFLGFQAE